LLNAFLSCTNVRALQQTPQRGHLGFHMLEHQLVVAQAHVNQLQQQLGELTSVIVVL
jgi:hypothetical protein